MVTNMLACRPGGHRGAFEKFTWLPKWTQPKLGTRKRSEEPTYSMVNMPASLTVRGMGVIDHIISWLLYKITGLVAFTHYALRHKEGRVLDLTFICTCLSLSLHSFTQNEYTWEKKYPLHRRTLTITDHFIHYSESNNNLTFNYLISRNTANKFSSWLWRPIMIMQLT